MKWTRYACGLLLSMLATSNAFAAILGCDNKEYVSYKSETCTEMRAQAITRAAIVNKKGGLTSSTGAIFKRNTSIEKFGEAYQDPSGLIWSNIAMSVFGDDVSRIEQNQAVRYCQELGGRLPTKKEYDKLLAYLGIVKIPGNPYVVVNNKLADKVTDLIPGLMKETAWTSTREGNFLTVNGKHFQAFWPERFPLPGGLSETQYNYGNVYGSYFGYRCVSDGRP